VLVLAHLALNVEERLARSFRVTSPGIADMTRPRTVRIRPDTWA
jgi:hypothetical protein